MNIKQCIVIMMIWGVVHGGTRQAQRIMEEASNAPATSNSNQISSQSASQSAQTTSASSQVSAPLQSVVSSNQQQVRLGIVTFGVEDDAVKTITQRIVDDFNFTGQFAVASPVSNTSPFFIDSVKQCKAPYVVIVINDETYVRWQWYDASKNKTNGKYKVRKSDILKNNVSARWLGHIIADKVYTALMGQRSPFVSKLVYCREENGKAGANVICTSDYDGTNEKKVLPLASDTEERLYVGPAWYTDVDSPAIFYSMYTPVNLRLEFYRFTRKPVTVADFNGVNMQPSFASFSENTDQMLLTLSVEGKADIYRYVKSKDGGYYYKFINNKGINISACVRKDGSVIFSSDSGTSTPQILLADQNGNNVQPISQGGPAVSPAYCPVTDQVVYVQKINGYFQLVLYSSGTSTQITTDASNKSHPSWSPCGNYIVCGVHNGTSTQLGCYNLLISKMQMLTSSSTYAYDSPSWSPNLNLFKLD